jgi:type I restriction enzyme S subunit
MMLSATDLLAIPILVPSLDVQRQIVAVLDSIQDAVTTKRAELDALRTLRQAVMMNELSDQRAKQENWERVPLSKVLTLDRQLTKLVADRVYKQVTVGMRGSGARLRHEILGESIHSPVSTIRAGQLLISKIDARNGALAIVPSTLDGAVVTNNFPHWTVADRQLTLGFLQCLIDIGRLTSLCNESALGTTNRKYTDPDVFMNLTVDLPPLYEQRQIVTTLDAVRHYAQAAEIELAALERLRQAKLQELIPA